MIAYSIAVAPRSSFRNLVNCANIPNSIFRASGRDAKEEPRGTKMGIPAFRIESMNPLGDSARKNLI
jgi:hypothetical protein